MSLIETVFFGGSQYTPAMYVTNSFAMSFMYDGSGGNGNSRASNNLVVEKRDSNNKPFTPRPRPAGGGQQQKSDHSKKPKNKSNFSRKK